MRVTREKKSGSTVKSIGKSRRKGLAAGKGATIKKEVQQRKKITPVKTTKGTASSKIEFAGMKKQYLKTNGSCRVTFRLPRQAALDARIVTLVGDFNNWNAAETKMKRLKSGDFSVTLKLSRDKEYRFKYLIDETRWENDWCADQYRPNLYGGDDSVVIV